MEFWGILVLLGVCTKVWVVPYVWVLGVFNPQVGPLGAPSISSITVQIFFSPALAPMEVSACGFLL